VREDDILPYINDILRKDNNIMLEKLKEIIERVNPGIDVSTVTPETKLMEDLKLDSLSIMLLAMEIENAFGFQFTEPVKFETVKDVCDYLATKA
jgi:acyl carrier protein